MKLFLLLIWLLHPLHVSVCEIHFNSESKVFEFSQRIFLDDLELALNKENHSEFDLTHPKSKASLDSALKNYLFQKVRISVDNKKLNLTYVGHEVEDGVYWIYFESLPARNDFTEIEISNTALFELYDDQSTILQIKVGDRLKGYRLHDDHVEERIQVSK